ncbi:unnamed protein product [Effrenium voratum]|nr:unnamed protein product [Effrenium voratum]
MRSSTPTLGGHRELACFLMLSATGPGLKVVASIWFVISRDTGDSQTESNWMARSGTTTHLVTQLCSALLAIMGVLILARKARKLGFTTMFAMIFASHWG